MPPAIWNFRFGRLGSVACYTRTGRLRRVSLRVGGIPFGSQLAGDGQQLEPCAAEQRALGAATSARPATRCARSAPAGTPASRSGAAGAVDRHGSRPDAHLDRSPDAISADAGYWSTANVTDAGVAGIDLHIATGRQKHGEPWGPGDEPLAEHASVKEAMRHTLRTEAGHAIDKRRKACRRTSQ